MAPRPAGGSSAMKFPENGSKNKSMSWSRNDRDWFGIARRHRPPDWTRLLTGSAVALVGTFQFVSAYAAEPAKKLVSLAPSNTELLYEIGAEKELLGVCTNCDYPEAAKKIEKAGT